MSTRMSRKELRRKKNRKPRRKLFFMFSLLFALLFIASATYAMKQLDVAKNKPSIEDSNHINEDNQIEEDEDVIENEEPITLLLVGVDTEEGQAARTDTIMIAQYNPEQASAKLISLMRDTYVEIPGYSQNKLNAAFAFGGPELLQQTIKDNFGIEIDYYAMVNFNSFVDIVDTIAPNGLEIDIEKRMYYRDRAANMEINFQPGLQKLSGEETLKYVRFRTDSQNDFGRVARQQEVLSLIKDELLSFSGITKIPSLIKSVEPHVDTNIKLTKLLSLGKDFVLNPVKDFDLLRIPIDGSYKDETYKHSGAVLVSDLEENSAAIEDFLLGKKQLTQDDESEDEDDEDIEVQS